MTSERIKQIQKETAYPENISVMLALKQVWNECEQERSYSESEVLVLLNKRDKHNMDNPDTFNGWQTPKEWFEQFKK